MAITQKQIAQHLGLSQPLVAQALGGHPGVAERTRARVIEAASELGYDIHSNTAARSLVSRRHGQRVKTHQIAVLMGDPFDGTVLQDMPFFREILQGIHSEAEKRDLDVAIHILREGNLPRAVLSGDIDGAICVYSRTINQDIAEQGVTIPVVRLDSYQTDRWAIYADNEGGTEKATRHLIDLGHQKIAFIGCSLHPQSSSHSIRFRGYVRAMEEADLSVNPELVPSGITWPSESDGHQAMCELLQQTRDFTAVVCGNDAIAVGAMRAAREAGLCVPEDISITGFDGITLSGYGSNDSLTTIFYDRRVMGRRAVEMLEEIASDPTAPPRHEILPVRLWTRNSTIVPRTSLV
jgi:DNA-binding LacI/PurR family transcriptional regulator